MPTRPSPRSERLGTPNTPAIRFTRGPFFEASLVRHCYGLSGCSPPWTDLTGSPQPPGAFTSRLPTGRSPFPSLDMTTPDPAHPNHPVRSLPGGTRLRGALGRHGP